MSKRLRKKFLKIIGIIVGSLLVLLTAFHFWFVYHAEKILQDLVSSKSNGKLKLEVSNFKFNWLSKKMELENAVFYSTDTVNAETSYKFSIRSIKLKVNSLFPMIFDKTILIDKLALKDPEIIVTHLQAYKKDTLSKKEDVSLPQEMGRIYNSIQDALKVLKVEKFEIENATVTLINKVRPEQLPVTIGRIDFHIDNLAVDTGQLTGKEKIFFSDNVALKSRDQDIIFPDGRHRISYRKFRINIEKRIVEFDSCTIAAIKTDSTAAGFSIYFDELKLTNIDFDTLYRAEVIKADSVYCTNPKIKLLVDLDKQTNKKIKAPKIDQVIRQLTGNLILGAVIVNNAGFDITTIRNNKPNTFTSEGNNFEMQGLTINNAAKRPFRVEKFAMAVRNSQNFIKDSQFALRFDSIVVNNDKIFLNNFAFEHRVDGRTTNRFIVPSFQLIGLSWDDLLLERKLIASRAILYNPTINYTETGKNNTAKKSRNLFDAFARMNEMIMLEDLNIVNGNIDMHLRGNIDMQLRNATISVESRDLLESEKLSGIRRSVNHLDFSKGYFRINDMTVNMKGIIYQGEDSRLKAEKVIVINDSKTMDAFADNVTIDEVFINETTGDVSGAGIRWEKADIRLTSLPANREKSKSFLSLTDIQGKNTRVHGFIGNKKVDVFFTDAGAIAVLLKPGEKPIIAGLVMAGKNLSVIDSSTSLAIAGFDIADTRRALFENIRYRNFQATDSSIISIPQLQFIPDIQRAISGEFTANEMKLTRPHIQFHSTSKETSGEIRGLSLPPGRINKLVIEQPLIEYSRQGLDGLSRITWKGRDAESNSIVLLDVDMNKTNLSAKQLYLSLKNFVIEKPGGQGFDAGKGEISALVNNIQFDKPAGAEASWKADIAMLEGKNFLLDSMGKNAGKLDIQSLLLKDLSVSSASQSLRKIIADNKTFRLQQVTGSFKDVNNHFNWYNLGYDKSNKLLSLDSFSFVPAIDQDTYIQSRPFQTDFIRIKTKAISIGPFDLEKYLVDSIVSIGMMKINDLDFTDYRDNSKPFKTGVIKPLMVDRVKSIPIKLSVDTILMTNSSVLYAEYNPKTSQTGIIPVSEMTLRAFPVRNFNLGITDSLRIQADGLLMDSIPVRIRLRESYLDTLSGFLLTVRMSSADMKILNPALAPLASAKLSSGHLDTLRMRVVGNDFLAVGKVDMFYHDLKIQLLKTGEENKKRALLNFLVNLIIKNKNTNKTHMVFFVRDRERSSVNYLIKMMLNGVKNTVGLKSNRKIIRQYKKELRQRNLPPIDYD